jgi:hypothetical protein
MLGEHDDSTDGRRRHCCRRARGSDRFVELGLELEGEMPVEGRWVDRVVGLDGVRVDIAMMRTPPESGSRR